MNKKCSMLRKLALFFVLCSISFLGSVSQTSAASSIVPAVAAGTQHSVALKDNGTVWTWGDNDFGQLGNGATKSSTVPIQVPNLNSVVKITAGYSATYALRSDGKVWAWGKNNQGELGDGSKIKRLTPVQVLNLEDIIDITSYNDVAFALKKDGTVYGWGNNSQGKVGIGTKGPGDHRTTPVKVKELTDIIDIEAGHNAALALKNDGTVWAWGQNNNGEIGDGTTVEKLTPIQLENLSSVVQIAGGTSSSMAVKSDGTVWNWGSCQTKGFAPCKGSAEPKTPQIVPNLAGVKNVTTGGGNVAAIMEDGSLRTWGYNIYGQLGIGVDGTAQPYFYPQNPIYNDGTALQGFIAVDEHQTHVLAIRNDGLVWSWGRNLEGQIGDGTAVGNKVYPTNTGLNLITNDQVKLGETVQLDIPNGTTKRYTFVSPKNGQVTISTGFLDVKADTILSIYDNTGKLIAENDDYNNSTYSSVTIDVTVNTRYVIEVSGYSKAGVRCTLKVE